MISTHLACAGAPRVLAVFSYRYDAHLVPAMLENLAPMVDGLVAYDDRASDALFSNELARRALLLETARGLGAGWALAVDPDERFEAALARHMDSLMADPEADAWSFAVRELYAPDHYRVDGIWGTKQQARLLSLARGIVRPPGELHTSWAAFVPRPRVKEAPFNIYHLKMITAARRRGRAGLYNTLDPGRRSQSIGYDYLADDQGAQLSPIPPGREYHPPHQDDGALWMPAVVAAPGAAAPEPAPRAETRRALVLTNHFEDFGGSEIVALEVAQWFRDRGWQVTLAANRIAHPIAALADGIALTDQITTLEPAAYDITWCQHDLLALLPDAAFQRGAWGRMPHVALVSLSPFEPYEHVDAGLAEALSADVFVNSPETREEMLRRAHGQLRESRVHVFHNAVPAAYAVQAPPPGAALRSLLVVSSKLPDELAAALGALRKHGIAIRHIGWGAEYRLLRPQDIAGADAVLAIGKTVPCALVMGRPVYVYGHLGGEGWLTAGNLAMNLHHNFSGRPHQRRLGAAAILREILDGYAAARETAAGYAALMDMRLFSLDHHLAALVDRAAATPGEARAAALRRWMARPRFRAHLQASRQKGLIARRGYLDVKAHQSLLKGTSPSAALSRLRALAARGWRRLRRGWRPGPR